MCFLVIVPGAGYCSGCLTRVFRQQRSSWMAKLDHVAEVHGLSADVLLHIKQAISGALSFAWVSSVKQH